MGDCGRGEGSAGSWRRRGGWSMVTARPNVVAWPPGPSKAESKIVTLGQFRELSGAHCEGQFEGQNGAGGGAGAVSAYGGLASGGVGGWGGFSSVVGVLPREEIARLIVAG